MQSIIVISQTQSMHLAESISHQLDGRRSGKGYRVRSVCHGGEDRNLFLTDAPDGKLLATCHSHHCEYKNIMQTLEEMGFKPKDKFVGKQRQEFVQKKSKRQLRNALQLEMHIALQYLNNRAGDIDKSNDRNYLKLHPEFAPMPDGLFDRERQAIVRVITLAEQLL